MFRLGAVLIIAGICAFGIGGFALSQPYQALALIVGAIVLAGGIVAELIGDPTSEELAAETGVEALLIPSPEVGLGKDMFGPDVFPQG